MLTPQRITASPAPIDKALISGKSPFIDIIGCRAGGSYHLRSNLAQNAFDCVVANQPKNRIEINFLTPAPPLPVVGIKNNLSDLSNRLMEHTHKKENLVLMADANLQLKSLDNVAIAINKSQQHKITHFNRTLQDVKSRFDEHTINIKLHSSLAYEKFGVTFLIVQKT